MHHKHEICIVASDFNSLGGAEKLTVILCRVLKDLGYRVRLITTGKVNWQHIQRVFGSNNNIIDNKTVVPLLNIPSSIYTKLYFWVLRDLVALNIFKQKCHLIIITAPSYPLANADIEYVHFPDFTYEGFLINNAQKYNKRLILRIYSLPYKLISNIHKNLYNFVNGKPLIVTNSKFSQIVLCRYLGCQKSIVVYPPVEVKKYLRLVHAHKNRENIVVTVSRFDPLKNLEVIPDIITRARNAKYVIIGGADRRSDYVREIRRKAKKLGVDDKLVVLTNASEDVKLKVLSKAKVYLHTMKYEHFGISIVEGMAAGLIPIVHRSGGPWIDILDRRNGVYGYAYFDSEEASQYISQILENRGLYEEISDRAVKRAMIFDVDVFKRRIQSIVETMLVKQ